MHLKRTYALLSKNFPEFRFQFVGAVVAEVVLDEVAVEVQSLGHIVARDGISGCYRIIYRQFQLCRNILGKISYFRIRTFVL